MTTEYQVEYKSFMERIAQNEPVDARSIGELVVRLAHYFSDSLGEQSKAEYTYQKTLVQFEKSTDEGGKALSSTKAENFAKGSPDYGALLSAKAHVLAIEQMINALKTYQRGVTNEFSHMGNS